MFGRLNRSTRWIIGGGVAACIAALIVWPLGELIRVAAAARFQTLSSPAVVDAVRNTVIVGIASAVTGVVVGFGVAVLTEWTAIPGARWLRLGMMIPAMVPGFVAALSWLRAYGPGGLTDDMIGVTLPGLVGPFGVVLVVAIESTPLAYLFTVAAMRVRRDRSLELAARLSGARSSTVLRTITAPLLAPVLLGVAALGFVAGINSFGVPAVLGSPASFDTITTLVYSDLARSAQDAMFERAVLMATCLVVAAFLFMIVGESLIPDGSLRLPAKSPVGPDAMALPGGRVLRIIPWMSIALVSWVPLAALILTALTKAVGLAATPPNLTLRNLGEVLTGRTLAAAGRSVLLAAVAATIVTVLSLAVVSLSGRAVRSASTAVMLGFAVPGSTVAVAMILGYGRALRDTLALILLAYVAKLWAVGHRSLAGLSASIGPDFAHAARVSGANARQALGGIVLPAIKSALGAGWAMVFIISFHELTMSALLYGPGTETLAVSVLNVQQLGDVTASAALAVVLTLPVIVGAIVVTVARAKRGST